MNRWKRRWAVPVAMALGTTGFSLVAPTGCSEVLGIVGGRYVADDAATSSDAGTAPGDDAGPWSCLSLPPQQLDPSFKVVLSIQLFNPAGDFTFAGAVDGGSDLDLVNYQPISGIAVAECALEDPGCQSPAAQRITDDAGIASFDTTGIFSGYFRLTGAGYVPMTFYAGGALAGVANQTFPDFMLSYANAGAFAALGLPIALDASPGAPGNSNIEVFDCNDHRAAGVVFNPVNLNGGTLYYVQEGIPSTLATQTDENGTGGINNLSSSTSLTVVATLATTGMPVGSATAPIRPGEATIIWIRPRTRTTNPN